MQTLLSFLNGVACLVDCVTETEDHRVEGDEEAQPEESEENHRRHAGRVHGRYQTQEGRLQGKPQDGEKRRR